MLLDERYEAELMNPKEALSLGSISQLVMPQDLRQTLERIRYILAPAKTNGCSPEGVPLMGQDLIHQHVAFPRRTPLGSGNMPART